MIPEPQSWILIGFLASLAAGVLTGVGAIPVLFGRSISERNQDLLLGFAAGVMLAASFFSLILPAIERSEAMLEWRFAPAFVVCAGVVIGVLAMALANQFIPHRHFVQGNEGPAGGALSQVWLFVIAITIHNFPEGLAVGVGFGTGDLAGGMTLAIGIGLQNAPEGLAVGVALRAEGGPRLRAFAIATLTGMIEPVGGLVGVTAVVLSQPLLPWALAFAAGAMIYVISHEIIPATHSRGNQREAILGLTVGFVVMMFLDVGLG